MDSSNRTDYRRDGSLSMNDLDGFADLEYQDSIDRQRRQSRRPVNYTQIIEDVIRRNGY